MPALFESLPQFDRSEAAALAADCKRQVWGESKNLLEFTALDKNDVIFPIASGSRALSGGSGCVPILGPIAFGKCRKAQPREKRQ